MLRVRRPSGLPRRAGPVTPGSGARRRQTTRRRRGACSTPSSGCALSCAGPSTAVTSTRPGPAPSTASATGWRPATSTTTDPPARIHGDLWAGNVVFTADGAVLIDPAAHGGHGLTDLAMLALFGCPGLGRVLAAYEEVAGLRPGWRELVGLHQLHPLAVHAASHGPAYAAQLVETARTFN